MQSYLTKKYVGMFCKSKQNCLNLDNRFIIHKPLVSHPFYNILYLQIKSLRDGPVPIYFTATPVDCSINSIYLRAFAGSSSYFVIPAVEDFHPGSVVYIGCTSFNISVDVNISITVSLYL